MSYNGQFFILVTFTSVVLLFLSMNTTLYSRSNRIGSRQRARSLYQFAPLRPITEQNLSDTWERRVPLKIFAGDDTKYFLYTHVLNSEHFFNGTNINSFRKDYLNSTVKERRDLIVTQNNTEVGSKIPYYLTKRNEAFTITEKFYNELPKDVNMGGMKTCTVVGNSGILINSSCGNNIDQSEFVFRCNAAPLSRFVKDAGNKSNVTSFNPSIFALRYNSLKTEESMNQFIRDMQEYSGHIIASWLGKSAEGICQKVFDKYNSSRNTFAMANSRFFTDVARIWSNKGLKTHPTTGFIMTMAALGFCDEVHLYGFWPFPVIPTTDEQRFVSYHYFDRLKSPEELKRKDHNMDKEFALLLRLHTLAIVRMHIGPCS